MKKTGFTLIELMVVIAIIAILAATFARAKKRTDEINNVRTHTNIVETVINTNIPTVGDSVIIESINTVGVVNGRAQNGGWDILTKNGMFQGVNFTLIKKIAPKAEKE